MSIADKLTTVAENQQRVYDAGYAKGKAEGGGGDYDAVYDEGYNQGKKDEYDTFWDYYQDNGARTDYQYAFAYGGWRNANFKPKYPLANISNASSMFARCRLTRISVPLDFRGCTNCSFLFNNAQSLVTISSITFDEACTNGSNMFASCKALENITVHGTINFDFAISACTKLTTDSVQSIIDALADLTGQSQKTATFASAISSALTSEQKDTISAKNWKLG